MIEALMFLTLICLLTLAALSIAITLIVIARALTGEHQAKALLAALREYYRE